MPHIREAAILTGQMPTRPGLKETAVSEPIRHPTLARQVDKRLDMRRSRGGIPAHELENGLVHMPIDDGGDVPGLNGLRHHLLGQPVRTINLAQ